MHKFGSLEADIPADKNKFNKNKLEFSTQPDQTRPDPTRPVDISKGVRACPVQKVVDLLQQLRYFATRQVSAQGLIKGLLGCLVYSVTVYSGVESGNSVLRLTANDHINHGTSPAVVPPPFPPSVL